MAEETKVVDVETTAEETKAEETKTELTKVETTEPKVSKVGKIWNAVKKPLAVGGVVLISFMAGRASAKKKSEETTDDVVDVEPTTDSEETAE